MEINPNAVFSKKDLISRFPSDFEKAITEHLLTRLPYQPKEGDFYPGPEDTSYVVISRGTRLEAINPDEPEDELIPLSVDDLYLYKLNILEFAQRIRRENQLSGKPDSIDDRLYFIGELMNGDSSLCYVLSFIDSSSTDNSLLFSLPNLLSKKYHEIIVICPSYEPAVADVRKLEYLGISLYSMKQSEPFLLPSLTEHISDNSCFEYSSSNRSIKWNGIAYRLSKRQNETFRILHEAYQKGTPDVPWDIIKTRLNSKGYYPSRMTDIFKNSPLWKTLVKVTARGIYRLNI